MNKKMNLTNKLLFRDVVDRINSIEFNGSTSIGPYVVELDPTASCDLACPGCISEDIIAEGGRINNKRLIELGEELIDAGVKAVILIGGGEPLVHPKAGELINLLGKSDIQIGITTNGTMIDRYIEEIAEYSNWTRVSMDAGTSSMFHKLRPSKTGKFVFDKVINNMSMLASKKKGLLGYSFLIQSEADGEGVCENTNDIYVAAKLAKNIGCDYFELKPSYSFRNNVKHSLQIHQIDFLKRTADAIEKVNELENENFKILHAINLEDSLKGVLSKQDKEYSHCPSVNLRTLITPKGVYACPYWRGKDDYKLGDITEQSFQSVWSSLKKKNMIDNLDPSKLCNFHCLRHTTNERCIDIKDSKNNLIISDKNTPDRFI